MSRTAADARASATVAAELRRPVVGRAIGGRGRCLQDFLPSNAAVHLLRHFLVEAVAGGCPHVNRASLDEGSRCLAAKLLARQWFHDTFPRSMLRGKQSNILFYT